MLSSNPFIASFTLLGWLLFCPSHWRNYVRTLEPQLPADFSLAEFSHFPWHHQGLMYLLLVAHVILPSWVLLTLIMIGALQQVNLENYLLIISYAYLFSALLGLLCSLMISVVFGIIISALGTLLLSLPILLYGEIVFNMAKSIAIAVVMSLDDAPTQGLVDSSPAAFLTVVLGIFAASSAGSIMYSTLRKNYQHPPHRQIGSVVIGVIVSGLVAFLLGRITSVLAHGAAELMESGLLFSLVYDSLIIVLFALSLTLIWGWHTWRWGQGLIIGFSFASLLALSTFLLNRFINSTEPWNELVIGLHGGIENAILYLLLFAFPYVLARRIANPWAGIIAGTFGSAGVYLLFAFLIEHESLSRLLMWSVIAFVMGLTINTWRPLLFYPFVGTWNLILYRSDERRIGATHSWIRWHSAFWDEHQFLPLFGLETYLVLLAERHPDEAKGVMEFISASKQAWAAREAQIELDARRLYNCQTTQQISQAHHTMIMGDSGTASNPVSALLRSFSRCSRDVEAALTQESIYNQRLALDSVEERLDRLLRELTYSAESYNIRFRPIAAKWRQILADYSVELSQTVESKQEIHNPYVIGIPLTEHQEIFVGRSDVSAQIERLLLNEQRCPPLLLYGQRRTGKTSLLNNLGKLLPTTIVPLFVDFQGPTSLSKDYASFLYNIGRAMISSAKRHRDLILPPLTKDSLVDDPFTRFDEWLDEIEAKLDAKQSILLTLDEFSVLEHVFVRGGLDESAVLGMFRHLIQHRPRFKILLSGSHTLDEFERWASYLINVQTVHLSYLQATEALQLIEQPVKDFALRYEDNASQRVMQLTRCHPALIQLLCAEIVNIKNKQHIHERRLAAVSDVELAVAGALQHGRFFFADIANNQVTQKGLEILRCVASKGENGGISTAELAKTLGLHPLEIEKELPSLLHRELLESLAGVLRFQVELIRRWFVQ